MKKILSIFMLLIITISSTFANETDFELVNNKWELKVNNETILVWTTEKNTSIIDLFKTIEIDWVNVENYINILDVRYVNPNNIDYKVNEDTDIIDATSKIYVLFKDIENGWIVTNDSDVKFETKNLILEEIWTISNIEDNSYNLVYNVKYTNEEIIETTNIEDVNEIEETIIDNTILQENNTWIKENIILMIFIILSLSILMISPRIKKI